MNIPIVVIAYNRPESLKRLLESLKKIDSENNTIPLFISIDYSGCNDVFNVAESFEWEFGEKRIIQHSSNLGLKRHVIFCGDLVKDFDAIIVLEDDLIVSPAMYSYAHRAVEYYKNDDRVLAISLYAKEMNEYAGKPFSPAWSNYDTYFISTAESWGQIWIKEQWIDFRNWYDKHSNDSFSKVAMPEVVKEWDSKSWKKHHIRYCIEKNKYTVYPYNSLTSCCGSIGEHTAAATSYCQVKMITGIKRDYKFADLGSNDVVKYDAFLERVIDDFKDTCLDLYGTKGNYGNKRYVITNKNLEKKIVDSFGLALRPHEENIIQDYNGSYFKKYDLMVKDAPKYSYEEEEVLRYYNNVSFSDVTKKMLVKDIFRQLIQQTERRVKKKFR